MKLWETDEMPWHQPDTLPGLPHVTPYLIPQADKPTPAVIICPGGGYGCLCDSYEGHHIAQWLNSFGFAGIVLNYRHAPFRHPVPFLDASRAMRLTRRNAGAWNLEPRQIGIMGFSAGGHLAATLATRGDGGREDCGGDDVECQPSRPDFQILVYPVIDLTGPQSHLVTRDNLLGPNPSPDLCRKLSAHLQVTPHTPPAFVAHSTQDSMVPVQNSRLYVQALRKQNIPVDYLELTSGDHGLGCGSGKEWETWQRHARQWLLYSLPGGEPRDNPA